VVVDVDVGVDVDFPGIDGIGRTILIPKIPLNVHEVTTTWKEWMVLHYWMAVTAVAVAFVPQVDDYALSLTLIVVEVHYYRRKDILSSSSLQAIEILYVC